MKTLKELLDTAVETEKLATIDLEAWPRNSLPSITNTVNEAKDNLVALKKEYGNRIAELTIGIFVLGDEAEKFASIAEAEGGTLTVRADALYVRIADLVKPTLADSREFSIIAFNRLIQGLTDIGHELELKALDMPKFTIVPVPTDKALVAHVRKTIRDAFDDALNRLYLATEIQKKAFSSRFSSKALPVVFVGLENAEEAQGLEDTVAKFGSKVFTNGNEIDKAYVLEVFASVKSKMKSKKTETTPETK